MTPQERQLLESLAGRVSGTPVPQKDPEAEALIRERLGSNPDALYVLTQTVLIQEMALNQANARLHELTQHQEVPQQPTSFLGRLFGTGASSRPAPPPQYAAQPPYASPTQYPDAYPPPPPPYYQSAPGAGSSFLRSAAVTATGVAAGALAFEGIESLLGHHGGGFGGGYGGGEFLQGAPSETIVNNYYDSPEGDRGSGSEQFASDDYQDDASSNDVDTDYDSANGDSGGDDGGGSTDV